MKFTWLAQAGILLERDGVRIMVDPYFTDSVHEKDPTKTRKYPADLSYYDVDPDVLIFTHDHIDHYDPETAKRLISGAKHPITVLCPTSVWQKVRIEGGGHNYVQFNAHTEWTEYGFCFRAVKAEHSDTYAIGVVIEDFSDGRSYYITGDTLYSTDVLADVKKGVDYVFLPINGVGNNMNMIDAARLVAAIDAKHAIPLHYGLYDSLEASEFASPARLIATPYSEIEL